MAYMQGKDLLLLPDGSTYHLGAKAGDIYPRIITVGSPSRAQAMSKILEPLEKTIVSARQFHIFSGKYKGVGLTIIAIGMGAPMMDFMVREASYVCPEDMAIIRVGTCGIFNPELKPGTVVTAGKGCTVSYIDHGFFADGYLSTDRKPTEGYLISKPIQGDAKLNQNLLEALKARNVPCHDGLNNAGDTFYACQGRQDAHFENGDNSTIFKTFKEKGIDTCEMESHTLFYLGKIRTCAKLAAAACHIGILNRVNADMPNIDSDKLHDLEVQTGLAAADALVAYKF